MYVCFLFFLTSTRNYLANSVSDSSRLVHFAVSEPVTLLL